MDVFTFLDFKFLLEVALGDRDGMLDEMLVVSFFGHLLGIDDDCVLAVLDEAIVVADAISHFVCHFFVGCN